MKDTSHFSANLRLLCGYSRSISQVCRDIGISRPQFSKYLSGNAFPSFRSLQRICDHFGLEEWEILLPHSDFRTLVVLHPPHTISKTRPFKTAVEAEIWKKARSNDNLKPFLGYWYSYFMPKERENTILKALVCLFEIDGVVYTRNFERENRGAQKRPYVTKYNGIAYYSGNRIYISEREQYWGKQIWHTILYASTTRRERFFSGLTMGSTSDSVQDIACYRTIFQFLGSDLDVREALKRCGVYAQDSPEISAYVCQRIINTVSPSENAISVR